MLKISRYIFCQHCTYIFVNIAQN